ncbi:MAG: AMP-binding protein [Pelagibacteraceae bacterium]
MLTLSRILSKSFKKFKNKNCIWVENKYFTYNELEQLSNKFLKLIKFEVQEAVCIISDKNINCYSAILATVLSNKIYVPLNPKFPLDRNKKILSQFKSKIIILDKKYLKDMNKIMKNESVMKIVFDNSNISILGKDSNTKKKFKKNKLNSNCYTLFTSGSTGTPKKISISNRNLITYLNNVKKIYKPSPNDRFSHNFDLTFDLSLHDIFLCWLSGACLYVTPPEHLINPGFFVKKYKLTFWFSVPSLGSNMLKMKQLKKNIFPYLKQTLFCGEPLSSYLVQKWQIAAPNSIIENLYGPTETTIAILRYRWNKKYSLKECEDNIVPIGKPFKNQKAICLGKKEVSELALSGSQVFSGYTNKKENKSKFVRKLNKNKWYKTGDLVKVNSAKNFLFKSRIDEQIKVRGHRVEITEIENAINKIIKNTETCVLGVPKLNKNNYNYLNLVAFVPRYIKNNPDDIIKKLKKILPAYLLPSKIIKIKNFPLNSNGKLDKNKLRNFL